MDNLLEVKKSKFYCYYYKVFSKEEVKKIISNLWLENKKAKHICYAFIVKENDIIHYGMTDDKEPRGTAGKPLLNLLQTKNEINSLIVVVRYYGGIKLGASTLLRTYVNCANLIYKNNLNKLN
ncbi:YigZ family protein [Mesomycoplasma lagogenitalium]|uniref:YigZ family protein n=1 Tax=Mesomycoplasma lagogenitalium TaxID=171286 RepID=A0ABY8LWV9_9BACT|nr:YigZ family protein [Mesomycoplasma lagogenitalium]WGI36901.1 YigZ family protein [Mesomycoplasma lagogenitalium]